MNGNDDNDERKRRWINLDNEYDEWWRWCWPDENGVDDDLTINGDDEKN